MRTGPDTNCILNRQHKDLSIAYVSGTRMLFDGFNDRCGQCIGHNNLKLGLLQASDRLIAAVLRHQTLASDDSKISVRV